MFHNCIPTINVSICEDGVVESTNDDFLVPKGEWWVFWFCASIDDTASVNVDFSDFGVVIGSWKLSKGENVRSIMGIIMLWRSVIIFLGLVTQWKHWKTIDTIFHGRHLLLLNHNKYNRIIHHNTLSWHK